MAYRYGNRKQMDLFPPSMEDYVEADNPVRAYDAFVEALDFDKLGIALDEHKEGNPQYNPKAMLKLLMYGYSYGIRSSRKLERAVHDNFSFVWLVEGLKPDHKTIAEFRRRNKESLKNVLKQCAQLCIKLDLITGNTLFIDGTKIRANASIKNTWTEEKCQKHLKNIDKRIEAILAECEAIDKEEQGQPSLVKLNMELKDKEALKSKINQIMKELKEDKKKSTNTTDPECTRINSIQGSHAGYNAQSVVDEKHGLIVNTDVVSENNDLYQFANRVEQSIETLGKKPDTACADSGYATTEELKKIDEEDIKVIVPSQRQASNREPGEFDKERFEYDPENDCYICPEGNKLTYRGINKDNRSKTYKISKSSICKQCCYFGKCTKSQKGRQVGRLIDEEIRLRLEAQYLKPESQAIYKLRKEKVELPFGHIKRNLGVMAFLLRGCAGAKTEISLLASCFNMVRMINMFGVQKVTRALMCFRSDRLLRLFQKTSNFAEFIYFYIKERLFKLGCSTV